MAGRTKRKLITLSDEDIKLYVGGEGINSIARRYRVSPARIKRLFIKRAFENRPRYNRSISILTNETSAKEIRNLLIEQVGEVKQIEYRRNGSLANFNLSPDEILEYQGGRSAHSLALERNSTSATVIRKLKKLGIKIRTLEESREVTSSIKTDGGILDPDPGDLKRAKILEILPAKGEELFELSADDFEAYRNGESISTIAERNNVSNSVIKALIHPLPEKPIKGYRLTEENISSYREGKSMLSIAQRSGVSAGIIKRLLEKAGYKIRKDGYVHEPKQRNTEPLVLTPEDILEYEQGKSAHSIASEKGHNTRTVISKLKQLDVQVRTKTERENLVIQKHLSNGVHPDPLAGQIIGVWKVIEFGAGKSKQGVKVATCISECCQIESKRTKHQLSLIKDSGILYCRNCKRIENSSSSTSNI